MPISELPKIYILTLLILLIVRMTRLTTIIFITTSKVLESPEFCSDIFLSNFSYLTHPHPSMKFSLIDWTCYG
jgi:hypothetical protein